MGLLVTHQQIQFQIWINLQTTHCLDHFRSRKKICDAFDSFEISRFFFCNLFKSIWSTTFSSIKSILLSRPPSVAFASQNVGRARYFQQFFFRSFQFSSAYVKVLSSTLITSLEPSSNLNLATSSRISFLLFFCFSLLLFSLT